MPKSRKHTPIVSRAQQRLFGAVVSGRAGAAPSLDPEVAREHLKESKGKGLPERVRRHGCEDPSTVGDTVTQDEPMHGCFLRHGERGEDGGYRHGCTKRGTK